MTLNGERSLKEYDTLRAWRFHGVAKGIENNMRIERFPLPKHFASLPPNSTMIKVQLVALNHVDIRFAETRFIGKFIHPCPAIPGVDGVGRVVRTTDPTLEKGQLVMFRKQPLQTEGALATYVVVPREGCAAVPKGVTPSQAATVGTCGVAAYQALAPFLQPTSGKETSSGPRVFINGGSGGTGVFQIQVAKALGCYVVTSCSTNNMDLCKSLGADEVINYRQVPVEDALQAMLKVGKDNIFDLVVDNIDLPWNRFKAADVFLKENGPYVQIGGSVSWQAIAELLKIKLLPQVFGGGPSRYELLNVRTSREDAEKVLAWMAEGRIKVPIDQEVPFEDVPEAYRKLKSGRTRGKILVRVCEDD